MRQRRGGRLYFKCCSCKEESARNYLLHPPKGPQRCATCARKAAEGIKEKDVAA